MCTVGIYCLVVVHFCAMVQGGGAGSTRVETSQDEISSVPHELPERMYRNEYSAAEECQSRPLDVDQKKLIDALLIQQREVLKELRDHRKVREVLPMTFISKATSSVDHVKEKSGRELSAEIPTITIIALR